MNTKASTYILTACLLGLAVYLKSPIVGVFSVVLIAVEYAKDILIKNNTAQVVEELKEIVIALQSQANQQRAKVEQFEKELTNVTARVRDVVGGDGF